MEFEELKKIITLLKEEGLSEITLWEGQRRITVRQEGVAVPRAQRAQTAQPGSASHAQDEATFAVSAPLVGTFYSRPSPEAEPCSTWLTILCDQGTCMR